VEYDAIIHRLREASGSGVDFSILCRAFWQTFRHAEPQVLETLAKTPMPKRPSKQDQLALAEYEDAWVGMLSEALRRMRPRR
jgi:hypothetical protein